MDSLFCAGGLFLLSQTAIPTWQSWYQMQHWQPGFARLVSLDGADNYTRAHYRYEFAGQSYQGRRVYVADFKDNIGSYHAELMHYLRPYQQNGDPLPIWINARAPQQAVIDRDMRWGLFTLITVLCLGFIVIGLFVVYASLRGAKKTSTLRLLFLLSLRRE